MNYNKRFSISFIANCIRAVVNAISSILIARLLGPEDTGRFFFLFFSFISIRSLIDFGSSNAFFTFISKTKQSKYFINAYLIWTFSIFLLVGLLIFYVLPESILAYIWLGEDIEIIIVSFIASFIFHQFWPIAHKMAEASRQTYKLYIITIITNVIHLICISILLFYEKNSIVLIFCIVGVEWLIASILVARLYKFKNENDVKVDNIRVIFVKYLRYCLPLAPYTIIGFFYSIGDKWMLQNWSGSVEQSYLGIGLRFSSIALLSTSALLSIFWKEVAVLYENNDLEKLEQIFSKTISSMYLITSIAVVFILPWSSSIINICLGSEYSEGILTITLLLLYPVHQCIGQITGSFLYAVEYTKLQSVIGCIFMLTSLLGYYIVLSPTFFSFEGFRLGSVGLACNIILMNIIFSNISLFYIYKKFGWKKRFGFQFIFIPLVGITLILKFVLGIYLNNFFIIFFIYSIFILAVLFAFYRRFKNVITNYMYNV